MSGGSHYPYTLQPNQHSYYPSYTSAPDHHHINSALNQDPNAYPFYQHGNRNGSHCSANFHPSSFPQQPGFQQNNNNDPSYNSGFFAGNNQYNHSLQSNPQQYNFPVTSGYSWNAAQPGAGLENLLPNFPAHTTHQPLSNNAAQYLQPGQWPQHAGTPTWIDNPAQSLSPQPAFAHNQQHQQQHQQQQQQNFYSASAARLPLKQENGLDSVSTPAFHSIDSNDPSPQNSGIHIKLKKRTLNAHETSSGGRQAQAQLQIEPPSNMVGGRPSRAAAAAASANINHVYSDTPNSRSLRGRQVKQQPRSEEDYEEEVSASQQPATPPLKRHDDRDDDDDKDDDDSEQESSEDEQEYDDADNYVDNYDHVVQPKTKKRTQSRRSSTKEEERPRSNNETKGKQKETTIPAPSRSTRITRSSSQPLVAQDTHGITGKRGSRAKDTGETKDQNRAKDKAPSKQAEHGRAARSNTAQPPKKGKAKPQATYQATRRSSRLLGDSQPESSQELTDTQAIIPRLTVKIGIRQRANEQIQKRGRQSDADEQDDEDEDAQADEDAEGEQDHVVKEQDEHHEPEPILSKSRSGRIRRQKVDNMAESEDSENLAGDDNDDDEDEQVVRSTRRTSARLNTNALDGFVAADDDEEEDDEGEYGSKRSTRSSGRLRRGGGGSNTNRLAEMAAKKRAANGRSKSGRRKPRDEEYEGEGDETPEEEHVSGAEDDPLDIHSDEPEGSQGKSYSLRQRKKVNYSLVPPPPSPPRDGFGRPVRNSRGRSAYGSYDLEPPGDGVGFGSGAPGPSLPMPFPGRGKKGKEGWDALPSSMTGKDYARIFGDPIDSSDDELQNNAFRKPGAPAPLGGGAAGGLLGADGASGAGGPPGGLTGSGGTDSFGRIKKSGDPLADVDPLGVDMNVDFDSVGGLDGHIQQLKEMVMLPLLYPEVFQRFKVTPPRGVLFHGPPGTGKTLVARALAASCSTDGQQVSFFMRKGADCLSKWVGEAERQLRLLFEEARNSQPSIIFFDEIDGLAPVRSSKQDQIHASIVSTMLALMDGMDGRGQVVVIGATNRPDSVDPALRRPGRFDREFYFPLPSLEARRSIINIHTSKWEPPLDDDFKATLAEVTKGYGGADLRALCTEAALNAVQRRYPQIYSTTDRLLLDPASIQVDAKDFMMSVNKIVPSSARASGSAAAPLPERLASLLGAVVQDAISVLDRILPPVSKRNPLEEALWEDDTFVPKGLTSGLSAADMLAGDRGFGREMLLQSFEAQRVYRPRMLVYGDVGMGQGAVGAALLQHLEGYHVQSLDIATLLGDSARTPEAAIIQLFVEAKRHKPSVLYIPGIVHWSRSVSESVKTTFKALLDGLTDADPVMLLGIAEAPLDELDDEVHSWFNFLDDDIVEIPRPDEESRRDFFKEIFDHVIRPPTEFPDALPRRKRVLEELPKAPPRPPRKLTQAELQQQADSDTKLLEHLKFRLGPVLAELRKKFKKFTRDVWDEYNLRELTQQFAWQREKGKITVELRYYRPNMAAQPTPIEVNDDAEMLETEADIAAKRGITAAQFMGPIANSITEVEDEQPAEAGDAAEAGATAENGDVEMSNDDRVAAPANGTNGIVPGAHGAEGAETDAGVLIPPPSSQPNGTNGVDASTTESAAADTSASDPMADTSIVSGPTNGTTTINDEYITRNMPIWTTNLEKMQKRLYYNGYLSCSAFLEDIQKIVENAEEAAEVDQDRVFRAHQMRNLAIILMDQYIDAGFREECDRMALRQMAREQEAKEATEKAKQSAEEAAAKKAESAKGERASARIAGKEPESAGLESVGGERGSKRQRNVSAQQQQGSSATPNAQGGATAASATVEGSSSDPSTTVNAPASEGNGEEEARKRARLTSSSQPSSTVTTQSPSAPAPEPQPQPQPQAEPEPEPEPHPPLTYVREEYTHLCQTIVRDTASYNVDQLSRLRAACFNAIWSHRSDWNRDELIGRLIEINDKSKRAVERERNAKAKAKAKDDAEARFRGSTY
ncbi:related to YTA7 - 26S proteasome subunit [Ustilago bromivora]|uniref:Related to YTA7 - 26S proteasome subunit n=1 Tax=Ustilago bromivora TaxID=307758 RepID=A0A8H8QIS1_9BASI|nr:related to YTA7 - 26S proteasome subunit [Ustilago bromivora]